MIHTLEIVNVSFDCSLDDDDWTEQDQLETEAKLAESYASRIIEVDVSSNADEYEIFDEGMDEVSTMSGWCINSIEFRQVLK
jgi:hypothetical protein